MPLADIPLYLTDSGVHINTQSSQHPSATSIETWRVPSETHIALTEMVVSYDDRRVWKNIDADLKDELLVSVISHLECLICSEVMHVPFLAQCGHSFCYRCLNSWFETKVNCPTCRKDMEEPPILNIQLREVSKNITDVIIESLEDNLHKDELSKARASVVDEYDQDMRKGSLFGEAFDNALTLVDKSDGVPRCGNCHWEAHGSVCLHCGARFRIPRSDLYFDSDDGEAYNEDEEEVELYGVADANDAYDSQDSFLDNRDAREIHGDRYDATDDELLSSGESVEGELWRGFRGSPANYEREFLDLQNSGNSDSHSDNGSNSDGLSVENAIDSIHRRDVSHYIDLSADEADLSASEIEILDSDEEAVTSHRRTTVVLDLDSD